MLKSDLDSEVLKGRLDFHITLVFVKHTVAIDPVLLKKRQWTPTLALIVVR